MDSEDIPTDKIMKSIFVSDEDGNIYIHLKYALMSEMMVVTLGVPVTVLGDGVACVPLRDVIDYHRGEVAEGRGLPRIERVLKVFEMMASKRSPTRI